jgi:hypothetical protein
MKFRPPSFIIKSKASLYDILKKLGVNVYKEQCNTLYTLGKVTPCPIKPWYDSKLITIKFEYGKTDNK